MLFVLQHWRVVAAIGVCLIGVGLYALGKHDARQQVAMEAAEATAKAIQKRADVDEEIIGMDSVALCNELGGLPEQCEQLRRVEADKP